MKSRWIWLTLVLSATGCAAPHWARSPWSAFRSGNSGSAPAAKSASSLAGSSQSASTLSASTIKAPSTSAEPTGNLAERENQERRGSAGAALATSALAPVARTAAQRLAGPAESTQGASPEREAAPQETVTARRPALGESELVTTELPSDSQGDSSIAPVSYQNQDQEPARDQSMSGNQASANGPDGLFSDLPDGPESQPRVVDFPAPLRQSTELRPETLSLDLVLDSVEQTFPSLLAAIIEQQVAAGRVTTAEGAFDLLLKGDTISQPVGFYENNFGGFKADQPLFSSGGQAYSGYKFGNGSFEPWYKEREKNESGEVALGLMLPLLKNRVIDPRRAELYLAQFDLAAVDPLIRFERNNVSREAAMAYWNWLAAGLSLKVQDDLIKLARDRIKNIELRVKRGDMPEITRIDNNRLLAARETKLIEAERKFQAASLKLSLFLRDANGELVIPSRSDLPQDFPEFMEIAWETMENDVDVALGNRPEAVDIAIQLRKLDVELAAAQNSFLPKLDAVVEASQDLGPRASALGDKTPYEMQFGLSGEVPWQRRAALGKIASLQGKRQQLFTKQELIRNKITLGVQDAYSAMVKAVERIEQARRNRDLALQSREIGERLFEAGDIDLIVLNIYEQAVADAEILVIEAEVDYFVARADYLNALGRSR